MKKLRKNSLARLDPIFSKMHFGSTRVEEKRLTHDFNFFPNISLKKEFFEINNLIYLPLNSPPQEILIAGGPS